MEITEQKVHLSEAKFPTPKTAPNHPQGSDANQKLAAQLTQVQQDSTQKIGEVATQVGGAKNDIEATRADLEATKGRLERTNGDMNVMSGLIAHNHDDVEELKRKGDRNYYEFTVVKTDSPTCWPRSNDLGKTDPKKSRYTVVVLADDRSIEKRDKTSGEPVQFYVGHARGTLTKLSFLP